MSDLVRSPLPIPLHHMAYLTDRPYRRHLHALLRHAVEAGTKFNLEWQHDGGCCSLEPQALTHENLIDQLNADGVTIWKVDAR